LRTAARMRAFQSPDRHPKSNNFGALPARWATGKLEGKRGTETMRKSVSFIVVALVALTASLLAAQSAPASANSERKVTSRVAPSYPELAKKMHIHGMVRVEAVVRPNGNVKSTRVLGGNPVLVESAAEAVAKWKFESAPNETTEVVQLAFEGQ
jgi:TonB family protein